MTAPKWLEKLPISVIKEEAKRVGINWVILAATAEKESNSRQWALRYESGWKYFFKPDEHAVLCGVSVETERQCQKMSWGMTQIMGAVARELGFSLPMGKLFEPIINFHFCALKYKKLLEQYPLLPDAISAYNQGSNRKFGNGQYQNQNYVSSVLNLIGQVPIDT
jgi:hypothetical protein